MANIRHFSAAIFWASSLLTACGSNEEEREPGGLTQAEAQKLDAAAERLDAAQADLPDRSAGNSD